MKPHILAATRNQCEPKAELSSSLKNFLQIHNHKRSHVSRPSEDARRRTPTTSALEGDFGRNAWMSTGQIRCPGARCESPHSRSSHKKPRPRSRLGQIPPEKFDAQHRQPTADAARENSSIALNAPETIS